MLMAKGKMGERVSEDAQLKLTDLVVDYGYKAGNTQKTRVVSDLNWRFFDVFVRLCIKLAIGPSNIDLAGYWYGKGLEDF